MCFILIDMFRVNVMTSCVKSDHKALVVNDRSSASSNNTVVSDYVRSPATVLSSHLLHWIIYI